MRTNFKYRGWIRASTRKSENAQRAALAAVGCTQIYVSGDDTLDDVLADLRKGDRVCMTSLARVSNRRADLAPFRKAVHAKGATIWEVPPLDRTSDDADHMADMMADAVSELTGEARGLTSKEAERNGRKGGKAKGKNAAARRTSKVHAKSVWYDLKLSNAEVKAHPDFEGWTASTAYREFGKRGMSSGPRKS